MTRDSSFDDRRAAIDERLETALESADRPALSPARTAVTGFDDRWYGQLAILAYESVATADDAPADSPAVEPALPAATAVELLRGYCRLRLDLLARLETERTEPSPRGVTAPLLAGDYLYSSAHSALAESPSGPLKACFRTLTAASETMIRALESATVQSNRDLDHRSFVDDTAGVLGEGAAVVGATLAGAPEPDRDRFGTIGRGFATRHRVRHLEADDAAAAPVDLDDRSLERHAERRVADATRALAAVSATANISKLRAFVDGRSTVDTPE